MTSTCYWAHLEKDWTEDELCASTYVPEGDISTPEELRRSQRERKIKNLDDFVNYFSPEENICEDIPVSVGDHNSVIETISQPDKQKWIDEMTTEI